jgi:CshA-type fibril repeat protein
LVPATDSLITPIIPIILADADDFSTTPVNGTTGGTAGDAYDGDLLNGAAVMIDLITPSVLTPAMSINGGPVPSLTTGGLDEGKVTVPTGTPAGSYTIVYRICEDLNQGNCSDATIKVVVAAPAILADADDFSTTPIDPVTGGTAGNVLGNDKLNSTPVVADAITIRVTDTAGIPGVTISPNGDLIIPRGATAGTYTITYEICEVVNPTNCDTANAKVVVNAPTGPALKDDISAGNTPGTPVTLRVFGNDSDPSNVFDRSTLTILGATGPGVPLVVPGEGTWTVDLTSGAITFTPEAGFTGNPTPIRYQVSDIFGNPITAATIVVLYEYNATFICSDVIGKVFDDQDHDGQQDDGESGIAGARLATVNGDIITTDEYGRYSIPCAAIPQDIGSTFLLKLDPRSLPTGYRLTTENPKTVRLTQGTMRRMNFGATISSLVRVDLTVDAFDPDTGEISAALDDGLKALVRSVARTPSTLRLSYFVDGESVDVAKDRLTLVEVRLRALWRGRGTYQLSLEKTVVERE